jgi:hypothetical protein
MRERWLNYWWMACATERAGKSTRRENDGDEPAKSRPIARRVPGRKPTASVAGIQLKLLQ